jgi:hypothetical protein
MDHIQSFESFLNDEEYKLHEAEYAIFEMNIKSVAVKEFLKKLMGKTKLIAELGFKDFKGLLSFVQDIDIEEFERLRTEATELGLQN